MQNYFDQMAKILEPFYKEGEALLLKHHEIRSNADLSESAKARLIDEAGVTYRKMIAPVYEEMKPIISEMRKANEGIPLKTMENNININLTGFPLPYSHRGVADALKEAARKLNYNFNLK